MLNDFLNDIQRILRGKNGTAFLVIAAIIAVILFMNVLGPLIRFVILFGVLFLVFRYLQKKS
jgi:hypothetical protein